jgi:hypothetical protein
MILPSQVFRVDPELLAHRAQEAGTNLLLAVLDRRESRPEVETTVTAFSVLQIDTDRNSTTLAELLHSPDELAPVHEAIFGHLCPKVKGWGTAGSGERRF